MLTKNGYIILGCISGNITLTGKLQEQLMQAADTANKRLKKRTLYALQSAYGSEICGLYTDISDALTALVHVEEELIQQGMARCLQWGIMQGKVNLIKDGVKSVQLGGKDLQQLKSSILALSPRKSRFVILTQHRQADYYGQLGLMLWDGMVSDWNIKRDCKALGVFLQGNEYKAAADMLNIAKPQAWKKYQSLGMARYFAIREIILSGRLAIES